MQSTVASVPQHCQPSQSHGQSGPLKFHLGPPLEQSLSGDTAIDIYASYLKHDVYLRQKFPTYEKWPPNPSKKIVNLALIKKCRMTKEEVSEFTKQTVQGDIDDIVDEKESISMEDIGKESGSTFPKLILVEGAPGVGKSTFAWKLCRKWSKGKLLQQYRLVVLLRLRDKRVREAKTVSDLFYYYNRPIQQAVVEEIQATGGRGVLLLFEGYDELPAKLRTKNSIFKDLIKGQQLPVATILITSRPSASRPLCEECTDYIDQHIVILGFTQDNIQSYIESNIGHDHVLLQDLQQYLTYYPHMQTILCIPLNCAIIVEVYRVNKRSKVHIPKTRTELYSSLLRCLLLRYLDDHPVHQRKSWKSNSFRDLPTDVYQQLCELGRIAYEGILQDQQVIFSDLPSDFSSLGLMQYVPELYVDEVAAESFSFLHLTLQEYMAAFYMSEQPVEKQIELIEEYRFLMVDSLIDGCMSIDDSCNHAEDSRSHLEVMMYFLAGLSKFSEYTTTTIRSLLSMFGPTITENKLGIILPALQWIFEVNDPSRMCEVLGDSVIEAPYQLGRENITVFDCFVLGCCVAHTNCTWEIDFWMNNIGDKEIEMLVRGMLEGKATHSGCISKLHLSQNAIGKNGLNQLVKIPRLFRLKVLDLGENTLGEGGAVMLLNSTLVSTLEYLNLARTGIGMEDCQALSRLLSSSLTLQQLDISENTFCPEAIDIICTGLQHNTTVNTFYMKGFYLSVQNCISLASVFEKNSSLQYLDLLECNVVISTRDAGRTSELIQALNLEGNPIAPKSTTAMQSSLDKLNVEWLTQERIATWCIKKLIDSLSHNVTLQKLILPLEYKSYADATEAYRRVEGRITWESEQFIYALS